MSLAAELNLETDLQPLGAPFPGIYGRPSTYIDQVNRVISLQTTKKVEVALGGKSISKVRSSKRVRSNMTSTGAASKSIVTRVIEHRPKFKFKSKKVEENEEEPDLQQPPAEEVYSSDEETEVKLNFKAVTKGSGKKPAQTVAAPSARKPALALKSVKSSPVAKTIVDDYYELLEEFGDAELEIRFFNIDEQIFNDVLARYPHVDPVVSTSEYDGDTRRVVVKVGGLYSHSWVLKEMVKKIDYPNYKLQLSREINISRSTGESKIQRKRTRYSHIVGPHDEYILDFTIVETTNISAQPKRKASEHQSSASSDRLAPVVSYEIELELRAEVPVENRPTLETMKQFADSLKINNYFDVLSEVGKLVHRNGTNLQRLLTQAISLDRRLYYSRLYEDGFFMTEKLDGIRAMIFIKDGVEYVVKSPDVLISTKPTTEKGTYVLDCELYDGELYVLDVVYPELTGDIQKRVSRTPRGYIMKQYEYVSTPQEIEAAAKKLYASSKSSKKSIDGLILVGKERSYFATTNYKWKPAEYQTIDFGLKLVGKNNVGSYDYDLYVMIKKEYIKSLGLTRNPQFTDDSDYVEIQFSPALYPIAYEFESENGDMDGKIMEMRRVDGRWEILRERKDKQNPNDYVVAESVFGQYYYPLTFEMLWNKADSGYYPYKKHEGDYSTFLSAMRHMFSSVIQASRKDVIMEAGSGNGGDFMTYMKERVPKVLAVEPDVGAAVSSVSRRYPNREHVNKNVTNIMIYIHSFGEYDPEFKSTIGEVYGISSFDKIVANLSAHYFMDTEEKVDNTLKQFAEVLKSGGKFIITGLDEDKVQKEILVGPKSKPRFHIKPLGNGLISVLMPFSGEYKEETPIHYNWLKEYGNLHGFSVEKRQLRSNYTELSNADAEYTSYHVAYILTKN